MKRRQLFEFTDLAWWPGILRSLLTDYLQVLLKRNRPFAEKSSLIVDALNSTEETQIIDLCAGASGPWHHLVDKLRVDFGRQVPVILTDKYPDSSVARKSSETSDIFYYTQSVDATDVPADLRGVRTMFNGFHHFPPDQARLILRNSVNHRQPIVIFELLQRTRLDFLVMLLAPLNVLLLTPLIRPLTIVRLLSTYVVPIAPLVVLWDCLVSVLRCYTPEELLEMARSVDSDTYNWSAGSYRHKGLPVTYLAGYPAKD